jgi:tRNA(fMet)-specific endonuclease VapC
MKVLLDTDLLSYLMRGHPEVTSHARTYLHNQNQLSFSLITRYEVLRGLHARHAVAQIQRFLTLCKQSDVVGLSEAVIDRAAALYGFLRPRGIQISDADLLIAATALEHRFVLGTNNERHYAVIEGLPLVNWTRTT